MLDVGAEHDRSQPGALGRKLERRGERARSQPAAKIDRVLRCRPRSSAEDVGTTFQRQQIEALQSNPAAVQPAAGRGHRRQERREPRQGRCELRLS